MRIEKVVAKQIEFQEKMNSNADTMYLALTEELGECVASMGYADWKKTIRDEKNIDIELVDIAVFAINLAYYSQTVGSSIGKITPVTKELDLIKFIHKCLVHEDYNSIYYGIFYYQPKLVGILTAKQALNQLRQDYGYKEGSYIKDWNGEEDNTYLVSFYGLSYEAVYAELEKIYTTKIIPLSLVNVHN